MSSPSYAAPLRLERRPSRYLLSALLVVHGTALLVLILLPVVWWIKVPLALAVLAQGIVSWRRQLMLGSALATQRLVWTGGSSWELFNRDGAVRRARLLPGSYIHPWLVVLRFLTEDRQKCAVVLPCDSLDPDSHRRLRVQLGLLQDKATTED
jgi:hypothetical protein